MDARRPGWRVDGARGQGIRLPSMDEVLALADAAPSREFRAYGLVAAFSGLRLFEVAALEPDCVWPGGNGTARLEVMSGKGGYYGESILFEPGLTALLDVMTGPRGKRIFSTPSGSRWDRKSVNKVWVKARRELGLDHVTFHHLRHWHATWLLDQGVSELDVAIQLRHRDNGELVRKRYGHPNAQKALDRIEQRVQDQSSRG